MLSVLGIVLLIVFVFWLIGQFAPYPPWLEKGLFIVVLAILVFIASGLTIDA